MANETDLLKMVKDLSDRLKTLEQTPRSKFVVPSSDSDPTDAMNGQLYYNTSTNKLRKYENGAWADV